MKKEIKEEYKAKDEENFHPTNVTYPEDGKQPVARYNVMLDEATREDDGCWTIIRTVKQVVTFDNKTWFVREFAVKSLDKEFSKANITTHKAMGEVLAEYDEDFFSKPKWKWNQYVMNTKNLAEVKTEEHHGIIEDVSNT